ncbi:hypothetical protein JZ751_028101 [Albula glossodonta]|uniref:Cation/H+ exchanger transmembrane domain-containing protein n=1 Tax=Albula glossodonta TaxID=121402 RepID=A0A8T2P858_9TELE|nr:hypothetical protein JZ751_028101 [Albula glossodonta]
MWHLLTLLYLGLVGAPQLEQVAQHAIRLHRGRGAAATHEGRNWVAENCRRLSSLLKQKKVAVKKLGTAMAAVERDRSLSDPEKLFQVHTLEIFQKELNESEKSVFQAMVGLQRALQGDYRDVEEQEYVELIAAEKHQQEALKIMQDQNKTLSVLDEILEDVRRAADRLEEEIEDHAFDYNKQMKGVNVEAVLRVEEEEDDSQRNVSKGKVEDDLGLSMLIDSQNNQYVLTKPRDSTMPRADHHFIQSMVQVETLGEFGVFFTLFVVGLEFSPERLRKVWKISVQGPCFMTLLMVGMGLLWGQLLQIRYTQTIFIFSCLSLSSTPLVSRFLAGGSRGDRGDKEGELEYSSVLLGMLVMQDVQLGLFIAVMPTLIQAGNGSLDSVFMGGMRVLVLLGQVLFSLAAVLLVCVLLRSYVIAPYYRKLHAECKGNKEILVLGTTAFVFLMLVVTELMDVSMELGCFLAGAVLSSQGHMVTGEVMSCIEPIRDFLAIIFFASIGLHVFPTFVVYELTILLVLTLSLVIMKFVMAMLVLSLILPPGSRHICWIVSAGLAQVSEFSFVLGSRARRAGIISREVYLLVLSVTTLSLLLAPVLWKVATLKCVPRPERRSVT